MTEEAASAAAVVNLLADRAVLIEAVTDLRWLEWWHAPEPIDRDWWHAATVREAGRSGLPMTWVASEQSGALGAVGLGQFDIEERRDRSPWVLGMIVRRDRRGAGIGRLLLTHLERWAHRQGYEQLWVATGGAAVGFYQRCGWRMVLLVGSVASTHGPPGRWWFAAGASAASISWFTALGFGARALTPVFRRRNAWRVLDGAIAVVMLALAASLLIGA